MKTPKYQITIELDNDAFVMDGPSPEVTRILTGVIRFINDNGVIASKALRDINGHYVGIAHLIEE